MRSLTESLFSTEPLNNESSYQPFKEEIVFPNSSINSIVEESSTKYITGVNTIKYSDYSSKFWFSGGALKFKEYYLFQSDENTLIDFVLKYKLSDFLSWVINPISEIFGDIEKTLHLTKCWDEEEYHLVLSIYSKQEDMDKLTLLEDTLFEKLECYPEIDHTLQYVVIAQR